jgi:ureidoglycolate dehydrogenase (NAD+)
MKTIQVEVGELRTRCVDALIMKGASTEVAQAVFDDYLEAEVRGRASHGFFGFDVAMNAFPTRGTMEIVDHHHCTLTIDGHGDCGHWVARKGIDKALAHLDQAGAYLVGIRDITRFNTPGPIANYGAERGAITVVMEYGGSNFIAPPGGHEAALSTNPLGIAIPDTDPTFVLDIAMSERSWGYVGLANLSGAKIPKSWGVDVNGTPTGDPKAVKMLQPFGGYKGFGLGLAIEILAGALVGVSIGKNGQLGSRGALIILIKPEVFGVTPKAFQSRVRAFLKEVGAIETSNDEKVVYPGEVSGAKLREVKRTGRIEIPEPVWRKLVEDTKLEV